MLFTSNRQIKNQENGEKYSKITGSPSKSKGTSFNYHEVIQLELKIQQESYATQFDKFIMAIQNEYTTQKAIKEEVKEGAETKPQED